MYAFKITNLDLKFLKVVGNQKVGGLEYVKLSQFGSDRGDRGSFLSQFCRRLWFYGISVSAPVKQNE
jgi:hypothetical protein